MPGILLSRLPCMVHISCCPFCLLAVSGAHTEWLLGKSGHDCGICGLPTALVLASSIDRHPWLGFQEAGDGEPGSGPHR